jgi:alpha amylase-like protein
VFSRSLANETFVIALNASESPQQVEVTYEAQKRPNTVLGEPSDLSMNENRVRFKIPARSGVVLS